MATTVSGYGRAALRFEHDLIRGTLLRRYKRFLADVQLANGEVVTAHTANPGAMAGLTTPGREVALSHHPNKGRKLPYTWELLRMGRRWVGVNPIRSNALVAEAISRDRVPSLSGYARLRREQRCGDSRLDLLLDRPQQRCWVEVKTATMMAGRLALFPDAQTERGRRHLRTLEQAARAGDRAVLCFVVQRSDVDAIAPADDIDPEYGRILRQVARRNVELLGLRSRVGLRQITLSSAVPIEL